jgi:4-alpha-glucanotransferase
LKHIENPGDEKCQKGKWTKAPGEKLFKSLKKHLGELPILAEDLGVITPPVEALRDQFGFPGMKVLQFAFGTKMETKFLPHNFTQNCVVYTGTTITIQCDEKEKDKNIFLITHRFI